MTEDDQLEMPDSDSESLAEAELKKIKEQKRKESVTSAPSAPVRMDVLASSNDGNSKGAVKEGEGVENEPFPENSGSEGDVGGAKAERSKCVLHLLPVLLWTA